jgi:hypothetical protein
MTIVAVGILYASVMPLIRQNLDTAKQCNDIGMGAKMDAGYTCFTGTEVQIQVSRGPSDIALYGIQLGVSGGGAQKAVSIYNGTVSPNIKPFGGAYSTALSLPRSNEAATYVVNGASMGITNFETVSASPILKIGTKEVTCPVLTSVSVGRCAYA